MLFGRSLLHHSFQLVVKDFWMIEMSPQHAIRHEASGLGVQWVVRLVLDGWKKLLLCLKLMYLALGSDVCLIFTNITANLQFAKNILATSDNFTTKSKFSNFQIFTINQIKLNYLRRALICRL